MATAAKDSTNADFLVVDDHAGFRELLISYLPSQSTIRECSNGREAIDCCLSGPSPIILMDIKMPEMDGFSATRIIRERHPDARIVLVSQYDGDDWRDEATTAGARAFINKDDLSQLPAIIESLLNT